MATFELFECPRVVFGSGESFIERQSFPQRTADHAHAVAVDGAEAEAFGLEFSPCDGVTEERISVPLEAGAGDPGIGEAGSHLSDGIGRFEHGVRAEDEDEISGQVAQAKVQHMAVLVTLGPVDDLGSGGFHKFARAIGTVTGDAEDAIGLNGLPFERSEHGWKRGLGIGEADEDADGG